MTFIGKHANVSEFLNGIPIPSSTNWTDVEILASFDNAEGPNISIERLQFTRDAYDIIKAYIDAGNIFEGLSYTYRIYNNSTVIDYNFWLDLTDDAIEDETSNTFDVKAVLQNGQERLDEKLSGTTYGYLLDQNIITSNDYVDVPYVVQKPFEPLEIATSLVVIYIMITALSERLKDLGKDGATSAGITASGLTGGVGAAIFAIAAAILEIAYAAALVFALIELVRQLLGYFIQPKRTHKGILLKTFLSKAAEYLGYGFETDIRELDYIVYLPSNPNGDTVDNKGFITIPGTIKEGIPHIQDFGYKANEAYELAERMFNAKKQVVNGVLQLRSENSSYWARTSTYILPDLLLTAKRRNTDELSANRFIAFQTDLKDLYTTENFKGTNYEVITDLASPTNEDPDSKFIKGLDEIQINAALGNRKESLSALENILKTLAGIADSAINALGGNSKFVNAIKTRVGVLKVSENYHSVPKLLWMENGAIPADHREKLSAKALENAYWVYKSFVRENGIGQKTVYRDVENIPFNFDNFLELVNNSFFKEAKDGKLGKMESIKWTTASDFATASFYFREPYTSNLKETFIEGE